MPYEILRTPQVAAAFRRMPAREKRSYEAARDALRSEGCRAGGYRLAAADGENYPLCCRHLAYAWPQLLRSTKLRALALTLRQLRHVLVAGDEKIRVAPYPPSRHGTAVHYCLLGLAPRDSQRAGEGDPLAEQRVLGLNRRAGSRLARYLPFPATSDWEPPGYDWQNEREANAFAVRGA